MDHFVTRLTGIALVASLLAAPAAAETVRIATEGAYPPFNSVNDEGEPVGFDVDIANALCAAAELECTIMTQEWDGIIPGLLAERYDVIVASMTITEERREIVNFTNSYYRAPARFVAAKGSDLVFTNEGMAGKVIGLQSGTVFEQWAIDTFPDAEVRAYPSTEEHNADLVAGRVDVVLADSLGLLGGFLDSEEGADFEFVGEPLMDAALVGDGSGIAVRKGEDELLEKLNTAIEEIRANGTYAEINANYFSIDIFGR